MQRGETCEGFFSGVFYELSELATTEYFEDAKEFEDGRAFVRAIRNGEQHSFATPAMPSTREIRKLEAIIRSCDGGLRT